MIGVAMSIISIHPSTSDRLQNPSPQCSRAGQRLVGVGREVVARAKLGLRPAGDHADVEVLVGASQLVEQRAPPLLIALRFSGQFSVMRRTCACGSSSQHYRSP
jgi:hypothetical protein